MCIAVFHDEHGSVMVEYSILLTLVSLGAVGALVALGPLLLGLFRYQRALLLLPIP